MTAEASVHIRESDIEGNPPADPYLEGPAAADNSPSLLALLPNEIREAIERLMSGRIANFSESPPC